MSDPRDEERATRRMEQALEILQTIRDVRTEHGACTAHEVARLMRRSVNLVTGQILNLEKGGLVERTRLPGSLRLTGKGGKLLSESVRKREIALREALATATAD